MFERLIEPPLLERLLVECGLTFYQCAYSPLITLWYLMFQRVNEDHTLDAVVTDAHQGGADALSQGKKPLSQRIRSRATTAYNDARQRLPVRVVAGALAEQGGRIRQMAQGVQWRGLWVSRQHGAAASHRGDRQKVSAPPQWAAEAEGSPGLLVLDAGGGQLLCPYRSGAGLRHGHRSR
jgi:hypothetical protein